MEKLKKHSKFLAAIMASLIITGCNMNTSRNPLPYERNIADVGVEGSLPNRDDLHSARIGLIWLSGALPYDGIVFTERWKMKFPRTDNLVLRIGGTLTSLLLNGSGLTA